MIPDPTTNENTAGSSDRCIVDGCSNHRHQGDFIGDLCAPCHSYITTGEVGPTDSFLKSLQPAIVEPYTPTPPWETSRNATPDFAPSAEVYDPHGGERIATVFRNYETAALIAHARTMRDVLRYIESGDCGDLVTAKKAIRASVSDLHRLGDPEKAGVETTDRAEFHKGQFVTHVKTGDEYVILLDKSDGTTIEATGKPAYAYAPPLRADGDRIWVRSASEMEDGRFVLTEGLSGKRNMFATLSGGKDSVTDTTPPEAVEFRDSDGFDHNCVRCADMADHDCATKCVGETGTCCVCEDHGCKEAAEERLKHPAQSVEVLKPGQSLSAPASVDDEFDQVASDANDAGTDRLIKGMYGGEEEEDDEQY